MKGKPAPENLIHPFSQLKEEVCCVKRTQTLCQLKRHIFLPDLELALFLEI